MALSKVDYNSINVTAAASKALKWNSSANGFETGDVGGSLVLLSTFTSDGSDDTATFASSIDSTYKEYVFNYISIHPQTKSNFQVGFRDGSTAYDATKTTTFFSGHHKEDGTGGALGYSTGNDLAQATGFHNIVFEANTDNDNSVSGILHLYDPSNTTFVKHFISVCSSTSDDGGDMCVNAYTAGYCNVTAAIDGVQFKFASGQIQGGVIKMYGVA